MTPALVAGLLSAAVLSALLTALAIPLLRRAHVIDIPPCTSARSRAGADSPSSWRWRSASGLRP